VEEVTRDTGDQSSAIIRENLGRLRLFAVAGPLLLHGEQRARVARVLANRTRVGGGEPLVMVAAHSDIERAGAEAFRADYAGRGVAVEIVQQKGHSESVGNAVRLFRERFDAEADPFTVKRQSLFLTRRGGKGKPTFISPFLGGGGTTCGEWTRPMVRKPNGSVVKGFMKASVAVGFCPVECPYCYLNMPYTDGMDVALNWEDLREELGSKWSGFVYPINFGETSGLVEYDEWFTENDGAGSMVQYVIDACEAAGVTPFFLTKIRYPQYLRFSGRVQVGISLMPERVRRWLAPHGSPAAELLDSLAWAWTAGAVDPVVRLTTIWSQREAYPELLDSLRDRLGQSPPCQ